MFLACMCACVSVVVTPPSPSSLSPSCVFSRFSPPPPLCVFPALFLTLGRQWRAPAPPLHRWRVLPHPTHTRSPSASTVHCENHTVILPSSMSRQMEAIHALHPVLFFRLRQLTWVQDFRRENTG